MRYLITGLLFLVGCFSVSGQNAPDWVSQRPAGSLYYIGIGRALKSDKDYMQVAKQHALRDLASEIRVEVSSTSLLSMLEEHERVTSRFEQTVRVDACGNIENFHMADSWQDESEYWVYYQLSVIDYEEYTEKRRSEAIKQGMDFLTKGEAALERGELMTAVELWMKGLEAVQPVINEELSCERDGRHVDVARELYNSVKTVFSGVTLRTSAETVEGQAFRAVKEPVAISVERAGKPLRNVRLQFAFVVGDGRLSQNPVTDGEGKVNLYVENITSNLPRQEIRIGVDAAPFGRLADGVFGGLVKEVIASAPQGVVYVHIGQNTVRAYISADEGSDPAVQRAVTNILNRNYFRMVNDLLSADMLVTVGTGFRKGEKQRAGVSAMVAYYASATVRIVRRGSDAVVLDFAPDEVKILKPESVPESTARQAVISELLKYLERQLPERLKEVYAE